MSSAEIVAVYGIKINDKCSLDLLKEICMIYAPHIMQEYPDTSEWHADEYIEVLQEQDNGPIISLYENDDIFFGKYIRAWTVWNVESFVIGIPQFHEEVLTYDALPEIQALNSILAKYNIRCRLIWTYQMT